MCTLMAFLLIKRNKFDFQSSKFYFHFFIRCRVYASLNFHFFALFLFFSEIFLFFYLCTSLGCCVGHQAIKAVNPETFYTES